MSKGKSNNYLEYDDDDLRLVSTPLTFIIIVFNIWALSLEQLLLVGFVTSSFARLAAKIFLF